MPIRHSKGEATILWAVAAASPETMILPQGHKITRSFVRVSCLFKYWCSFDRVRIESLQQGHKVTRFFPCVIRLWCPNGYLFCYCLLVLWCPEGNLFCYCLLVLWCPCGYLFNACGLTIKIIWFFSLIDKWVIQAIWWFPFDHFYQWNPHLSRSSLVVLREGDCLFCRIWFILPFRNILTGLMIL